MRWILVFLGSLATGVLAIVVSLVLLLVSLSIYERYVLGIASNETVGWDQISIYGVLRDRLSSGDFRPWLRLGLLVS